MHNRLGVERGPGDSHPEGIQREGEAWFYYASDRLASVPIKARVDRETGLVLSLHCDEGGAAWTLDPSPVER